MIRWFRRHRALRAALRKARAENEQRQKDVEQALEHLIDVLDVVTGKMVRSDDKSLW